MSVIARQLIAPRALTTSLVYHTFSSISRGATKKAAACAAAPVLFIGNYYIACSVVLVIKLTSSAGSQYICMYFSMILCASSVIFSSIRDTIIIF